MKAHPTSYRFPKDFVWGVATAATQIEGAAHKDGKGESIWDRFAATPGKVANGDTPTVACDHYHRYAEDFALMRHLGIQHHRLSVSWPRLFPSGRGGLNQRGLDFYHRLVDSMLAHGVTPWITLYHWDLPQCLEEEGGWRVRTTVDAFAQYANVVVRALGDRVKNWITLNEIPCFIGLALKDGMHAPGRRDRAAVVNQAYHHALLAHGRAVSAVREHGGRGARVGLAHNPEVGVPVLESDCDIQAAQKWTEQRNWHLLGPILKGRYPSAYLRACTKDRPKIQPGDLALISQPMDFLGLNIYKGVFVRAGTRGQPEELPFPANYPRADLAWLTHMPQSIYWGMRHLDQLYRIKNFYITENGAGYEEKPDAQGEINDLHRREYLRNYLLAVQRGVADGLPVRGYFLWSFMDNFEWAEGNVKRFGIVYTDYKSLRRTPKLSARWFAEVMRSNRVL